MPINSGNRKSEFFGHAAIDNEDGTTELSAFAAQMLTPVEVLAQARVAIVGPDPAFADMLAQELRAAGATVGLLDHEGRGADRTRNLDPQVILVDRASIDQQCFWKTLQEDSRLRWANIVDVDWKKLWPVQSDRPSIIKVANSIFDSIRPDRALRVLAGTEHARFRAPFTEIGPGRVLAAIAGSSDDVMRISVDDGDAKPRAQVEVCGDLIVGAAWWNGREVAPGLVGIRALSAFLNMASGQAWVERREHARAMTIMSPVHIATSNAQRGLRVGDSLIPDFDDDITIRGGFETMMSVSVDQRVEEKKGDTRRLRAVSELPTSDLPPVAITPSRNSAFIRKSPQRSRRVTQPIEPQKFEETTAPEIVKIPSLAIPKRKRRQTQDRSSSAPTSQHHSKPYPWRGVAAPTRTKSTFNSFPPPESVTNFQPHEELSEDAETPALGNKRVPSLLTPPKRNEESAVQRKPNLSPPPVSHLARAGLLSRSKSTGIKPRESQPAPPVVLFENDDSEKSLSGYSVSDSLDESVGAESVADNFTAGDATFDPEASDEREPTQELELAPIAANESGPPDELGSFATVDSQTISVLESEKRRDFSFLYLIFGTAALLVIAFSAWMLLSDNTTLSVTSTGATQEATEPSKALLSNVPADTPKTTARNLAPSSRANKAPADPIKAAVPVRRNPAKAKRLIKQAKRTANRKEKLRLLQQARAFDRRNPHAHAMLATEYIADKNSKRAIESATVATTLRKKRVAYKVLLGDAYRSAGDSRNARSNYREALRLDPKDREARRRIRIKR